MYWIEYRDPEGRTLFETNDLGEATFELQGIVLNKDTQLIDYDPELDGVLDSQLAHVRLYDDVQAVVRS